MADAHFLITKHIDIWTSAIKKRSATGRGSNKKIELTGIKKLRELILELAVRGQLVPQDPNDEPASVLLEKIAAEKAQLIKDKKIKKTKVLPGISEGEKLFNLPDGWEFVRLNDLGEWGAGATPRRGNSELYGGDIPWFKSGELNADYISEPEEMVTELALKESSLRYNKIGDVLIAMYGATIGKTAILSVRATTNQAVCACTPFRGLENTFLLMVLKAFRPRFISKGAGGAQPNISREKIIATIIALPTLAEQHRIVAKVDELMALCDQLEQQTDDSITAHKTLVETLLATLTNSENTEDFNQSWARIAEHFDTLFTTEHSIDQLKQTVLQLAVMGKLTSSGVDDFPVKELIENIYEEQIKSALSVKERKLIDIEYERGISNIVNERVSLKARFFCDFITKGTTPSKNELLETGEVPFLKVYNIVKNKLDFEYKPIFISWKIHNKKLKRSRLYPDDVIMNIVGPPLGKIAIINNDYPEWNMNQALAVFRPLGGIFNKYIYYILSTESILKSTLQDVKGTAGQDNLSLEQCRELLIPIPSVQEQHRIVKKVDELMILCDQLKTRLNQAQTIQLHLADTLVKQAVN